MPHCTDTKLTQRTCFWIMCVIVWCLLVDVDEERLCENETDRLPAWLKNGIRHSTLQCRASSVAIVAAPPSYLSILESLVCSQNHNTICQVGFSHLGPRMTMARTLANGTGGKAVNSSELVLGPTTSPCLQVLLSFCVTCIIRRLIKQRSKGGGILSIRRWRGEASKGDGQQEEQGGRRRRNCPEGVEVQAGELVVNQTVVPHREDPYAESENQAGQEPSSLSGAMARTIKLYKVPDQPQVWFHLSLLAESHLTPWDHCISPADHSDLKAPKHLPSRRRVFSCKEHARLAPYWCA